MILKYYLNNFIYLAWLDLKIRYRNTLLGPFWSTISLGVTLIILGFVWTKVLNADHYKYIPNLYFGYIFWVWISDTLSDSVTVFGDNKDIIHNFNFPLFYLNFKIIIKNLLIFLHNFPIILIIIYIYNIELGFNNIFFIISIFLTLTLLFSISIIISIMCAFYDDFKQATLIFLKIIFYTTPILWLPEMLGDKQFLLFYNPFFHIIELLRNTLTAPILAINSFMMVIYMNIIILIISIIIYKIFNKKVIHWI